MNPGRAMAQAAHAANQFIYERGSNKDVRQWQKDANGFGTTICLAATKIEIEDIVEKSRLLCYYTGLVYDPTYKFDVPAELAPLIVVNALTAPSVVKEDGTYIMFRNELTCGYLFISNDDINREMLIGTLSLHP